MQLYRREVATALRETFVTPFRCRARSRRWSLLEGLEGALGFEHLDRFDHG
jgi:hypothetical protein